MPDLEDMQRQAADPHTPLSTLQSIAQDYPALRPVLALNPSTYPGLLEWLRDLDEPGRLGCTARRGCRTCPGRGFPGARICPGRGFPADADRPGHHPGTGHCGAGKSRTFQGAEAGEARLAYASTRSRNRRG